MFKELGPYMTVGFGAATVAIFLDFLIADRSAVARFSQPQPLPSVNALEVSSTASRKGDLLVPRPAVKRGQTVSAVELVGLQSATVMLRDAKGRILYRNDPLAGNTVVSKNTVLPQIIISETNQAPPHSAPIEPLQQPSTLPEGCEHTLSSWAAISSSHTGVRCITKREDAVRVARQLD